jgi:hypothetical protein
MPLISHWKLDDNAASTTVVATVGNNGTLGGGENTSAKHTVVSWGPSGSITSAFDLNGTDDVVSIDVGSPDISVMEFALSIWAKLDAVPGYLVGTAGSDADSFGVLDDTTVRFRSNVTDIAFTVPSLGTTNQHHFVVTRDSLNFVRVYVDGVESSTGAQSLAATFDPRRLGLRNTTFFNGLVADLRVYDHALSESEILDLYDASGAGGEIATYCGIGGTTDSSTKYRVRCDTVGSTVQIEYSTASDLSGSTTSTGFTVTNADDRVGEEEITGLSADTVYHYSIVIDGTRKHASPFPFFKTFPAAGVDANLKVIFGSCQLSGDESTIFAAIAAEDADLFIHLGDFGYTDSTQLINQRTNYRAQYNDDFLTEIVNKVTRAHIWDDHDYAGNNSHGDMSGKANSLQAFKEYLSTHALANGSNGLWRKFTAANAEFFVLDSRYQREGTKVRFPTSAGTTFTADSGSGTASLVLKAADSPSAVDDFYNGYYTELEGVVRRVTDYVAATRTCTLSAAVTGLDNATTYYLRKASFYDQDMIASGQTDWIISNINSSTRRWKVIVSSTAMHPSGGSTDTIGGWDADQIELKYLWQEITADDVVSISGDRHGAGIDDGTNSHWPEACISPFNQSDIGVVGTWSEGIDNTGHKYGVLEIDGTTDELTLTCKDADGTTTAGVTPLVIASAVSSFTATIGATLGAFTASLSATFAPGEKTASIAADLAPAVAALEASFTQPAYTANIASNLAPVTAALTATFEPESYTASIAAACGVVTAALAATFEAGEGPSFASVGTLGTGVRSTGGTSTTITTSATAEAGNVVIVAVGKDNTQTTDGATNEVTGVTDSAGNTYEKAGEFTNGEGSAGAGATVAVFLSQLETQLDSGGTITVTHDSQTDVACSAWEFTTTLSTIALAGTAQTLANDAADPGSMSISGLAEGSRLYFRAIASESETATAPTPTSDYTAIDGAVSTTAGQPHANICIAGEFRIVSGTGSTSDPTLEDVDSASLFIAIGEGAGSFASAIAAALGPVTASLEATFAPGTKTANIAASVGPATAALTATFTPPQFSAAIAADLAPASAAVSATFTQPAYTANIAADLAPATAALAVTFDPGTKTANIAADLGAATAALTATFTSPTFAAAIAVACGPVTTAIQATFTLAGAPFVGSPAASADDGWWNDVETFVNNGASVIAGNSAGTATHAFFRFPNVTIPVGATITNAVLTLTFAGETAGYTGELAIVACDEDDSAQIADSDDADGRPETTASVAWEPGDSSDSSPVDTPNLSTVLQEVLNRPGRSSGDAIQLFVKQVDLNQAYGFYAIDNGSMEAVLTVAYTEDAFAAAISAALGPMTTALNALFTEPVYSAAIAALLAPVNAAMTATFVEPIYEAAVAVELAAATAALAVTFEPPIYEAAIATELAPVTAALTIQHATAIFEASITASLAPATAEVSATFDPGTKTTSIAVTCAPLIAALSISFEQPVYEAALAVDLGAVTTAMGVSFDQPAFAAAIAGNLAPVTAEIVATFAAGEKTVNIVSMLGSIVGSITANVVNPVLYVGPPPAGRIETRQAGIAMSSQSIGASIVQGTYNELRIIRR